MYDHFFVTRQAVEDGLGVDIGPMPMLSFAIAAGRLIAPLPHIKVQRVGYVALLPGYLTRERVLDAFVDWLSEEGRRHNDMPPPA